MSDESARIALLTKEADTYLASLVALRKRYSILMEFCNEQGLSLKAQTYVETCLNEKEN